MEDRMREFNIHFRAFKRETRVVISADFQMFSILLDTWDNCTSPLLGS